MTAQHCFPPTTDGQTERRNSTIEADLRVYCQFEQDNWVCWLLMAEFAYKNSRQASPMMSPFEVLLGYHPWMFYKDNCDPLSKSWTADENAATLRNLIKKLKVYLTESQELQAFYHNKHVKERTYWLVDSVWLNGKHIKTKKNPKLERKYLSPFEILEAVGKQVDKLKLLAK